MIKGENHSEPRSLLQRAREILQIESRAILDLRRFLDSRFERAVQMLLDCSGRVAVLGVGKSGLIGRKLSATLSSTGTPSFFLHPAESIHGDLGMLTEEDIALVLSYSGESEEIRKIVPLLKHRGIPIIALTGHPHSRLGRMARVVLPAAVRKEACPYNLTPTASTAAMLALGDALAIVTMERRGFKKEDFARLHPGGTLGKRLLLKVEDLMRKGRENPVARENQTVREALKIMTQTRLGAASVVDRSGRLVGFFTDGDLRRKLARDPKILSRRLREVMTRNPIAIAPHQLAEDAAKLLKRHQIDNLPVVDPAHRPRGILDERDLLAEGL